MGARKLHKSGDDLVEVWKTTRPGSVRVCVAVVLEAEACPATKGAD